MERRKHSLWIVPEGQAKVSLDDIVTSFASETGSIPFIPHMTLIGDLVATEADAIEATKTIASQTEPFDITLTESAVMDEFYRCVFAKAAVTDELRGLYAVTHAAFPSAASEHFVTMPHLSVLYGEYDHETKAGYATRLQDVLPLGWRATRLTLLYTDGKPENWRVVTERALGEQ